MVFDSSTTQIVVLITNIRLRRGEIWNLAFKHHGKVLKLIQLKFPNFSVVFDLSQIINPTPPQNDVCTTM